MVAAEHAPLRTTVLAVERRAVKTASGAAKRRGELLAIALVAVSCAVTMAAAQLRQRAAGASVLLQTSKLDVAGSKESYSGISSGLMGSLEKAMDQSIDNKVNSFLSAPAIGSIPVPQMGSVAAGGGHGEFIPKAYQDEYLDKAATHSYLSKLSAQKRQLEREKQKLMSDLRARHKATATQAAQDSIAFNEEHLARAREIAQFRLAQQAQQAARAMAKKMREATIAKQTYIHAEAVADSRVNALDAMVHETNGYGHFIAKPKSSTAQQLSAASRPHGAAHVAAALANHAAADKSAANSVAGAKGGDKKGGSVRREDAKKGTKLYHYLQQQKELEAKISAAERAAKKKTQLAAEGSVQPSHASKVQSTFIRSIAEALFDNKQAIKKDESAAAHLKTKQQALYASMKALKHSDKLLFQKVNTADSKA